MLDFAHADVRPYPYQQEILDGLAAEPEIHDRSRNLVVMATGTGKTVVAALATASRRSGPVTTYSRVLGRSSARGALLRSRLRSRVSVRPRQK
ncbi:DEAD/DEAH box helicase family protein [Nonomuraea sp. CA-141351]|uniref:DEAD/DEAH box helicase family protein n=1 Tax=Nonomuraea sp. CA-141351 TaxID=3239996 RepID=UPI003D922F6D